MNIDMNPILVVEDIPNILELLEVTLRFKGYTVITARNGQEALDKIAERPPALVVTDILMPIMNGYTLAYTLKKNPLTRSIPIIFVSATFITPEDKKFAHQVGGVRFLEKPIDTEEFLLTVAEILTQGLSTQPRPIDDRQFYSGYRDCLQVKLEHKNAQIMRMEKVLENLPQDQKSGFEDLLAGSIHERNQIHAEMDQIQRKLID